MDGDRPAGQAPRERRPVGGQPNRRAPPGPRRWPAACRRPATAAPGCRPSSRTCGPARSRSSGARPRRGRSRRRACSGGRSSGLSAPRNATPGAVGRNGREVVHAGLLGEGADCPVQRHDVQVLAQIVVPGVVAGGGRDHAEESASHGPRRAGTARGSTSRGSPVPSLATAAKMSFRRSNTHPSLSNRLKNRSILRGDCHRSSSAWSQPVASPAGERQPAPIGRPLQVGCSVGHGGDGAHLARTVDGEHVDRLSWSFSPRLEAKASHRPSGDHCGSRSRGPAVIGAGSPRSGEPDAPPRWCCAPGRSLRRRRRSALHPG